MGGDEVGRAAEGAGAVVVGVEGDVVLGWVLVGPVEGIDVPCVVEGAFVSVAAVIGYIAETVVGWLRCEVAGRACDLARCACGYAFGGEVFFSC